jgi:hypothetical protein
MEKNTATVVHHRRSLTYLKFMAAALQVDGGCWDDQLVDLGLT